MTPRTTFETAAPLVPEHYTLDQLKQAASGCRACPLWMTGTQTVFGEGLPSSKLIPQSRRPLHELVDRSSSIPKRVIAFHVQRGKHWNFNLKRVLQPS